MRGFLFGLVLLAGCGSAKREFCDTLGCADGLRCDAKTGLCVADVPPTLSLNPVNGVQTQAVVEVTGQAKDDVSLSKAEFSIDDGGTWARAAVERETLFASVSLPALDSKLLSVAVRVFDTAGQQADAGLTFIVDRVGPSSTLLEPLVRVGGERVTVIAKAEDGSGEVASMRLVNGTQTVSMMRLDGGRFSTELVLPQLVEARLPLAFIATDGYGNETTTPAGIEVATRGPAFDLVPDGGIVSTTPRPVFFRSASPTFGVSATWRGQPVGVADAGAANLYSVVLSVSAAVAETVGSLQVSGVDSSANRGNTTLMVSIDVVGPVIRFISPADASVWGGEGVDSGIVSLDISDMSGVGQVSVDFGDDAGFRMVNGPPWNLSIPLAAEDGVSHVLRARAVDWLGNPSQAVGPTVIVDTVAPTITAFIEPTYRFGLSLVDNETDVSVNVDDRNPRALFIEITDFSGAWFSTGNPPTGTFFRRLQRVLVPTIDYQSRNLSARARDAAGNWARLTQAFVIDRVAPLTRFEAPVTTVTSASAEGGARFPVELRSSDSSPGLQFFLRVSGGAGDGVERLVLPSSFVATLPTDNGVTYTLAARAVDLVGNQGPVVTMTVLVDRVP